MNRTSLIVLTAVVAGAGGGGLVSLVADDGSSASNAAAGTQVAAAPDAAAEHGLTPQEIYRRDAPAVVVITATETQKVPATFFSPPTTQKVESLGSGFVVDTRGDIVTNDHVVAGAKGIRVGFSGGKSYPATVVGADPSTDVAVVRVNAPAKALHPLAFDTSTTAAVGSPVYAIGNPFGLDRTMTAGIVSAVGRDIQAPNGETIPNSIQTDAPINHGNSGGPLIDAEGSVVGIASQIQSGTVNANVGIGFAVPSATASTIANELIAHGHAEHAWLGVQVETIDPSVSKVVRGLPSRGVVVAAVEKGSPAARAGLKGPTRRATINGVTAFLGGDAIVAVDGKPVADSAALQNAVSLHKPGDRITLTVSRNGKGRIVDVTLGNVPANQ
jgi:S1-C subfamily serine protease